MAKPPPPEKLPHLLAFAALAAVVLVTAFWPASPIPTRPAAAIIPSPWKSAASVPSVPLASLVQSSAFDPAPATAAPPRIQTPPLPPVFGTFPVVARQEIPLTDSGDTEIRRIVRAPFKYPWLRIRSVMRGQRVIAEEAVVADQLLVSLQPGTAPATVTAVLAAEGIAVLEVLRGSDTLLLQLPGHELDSVDRARAQLEVRGDLFQSVDPNGIGFAASPNDPRFPTQWALQNTGQGVPIAGVVGADVNAVGLWSITSSAPKVLVAVLDSGMDFAHQDLVGVGWTNPGEIPGNGIDDDGNGFIDDMNGWDFVNADNNPADDQDHGSHVTGIIAARRDNAVGISGLADPATILPVKILNNLNAGTTNDLIAGLDYARLKGARVMNLSLQNYPANGSLQAAMDRAETAGIVICACAGNQSANNDLTPNYPSSFTNANIIAVANHDRTDVRWTGSTPSNYGLTSVDLFAPGREVVSTVRNNLYSAFTGTSMSCPHVTAVAAIIRALNPAWTPADVKGCILATVTTRPAYNGICVTGGRLNAEAAIKRAIKLLPGGDPDGDGTPSLAEYALGIDPLRGNATGLPVLQNNGATLELSYQHARSDVSYLVEASDDLINWDGAIVNQGGAGSPVTATAPLGIAGQRFLRLKVGPLP